MLKKTTSRFFVNLKVMNIRMLVGADDAHHQA